MIRLSRSFLVLLFSGLISAACSNGSGDSGNGAGASPDGNHPTEVAGSTPFTRTAWCAADFRENKDHQARLQFRDNLSFESSYFQMNPDNSRGPQKGLKEGAWTQIDEETLSLTLDGRSTEVKIRMELATPEIKEDRLFMGPNKNQMDVFFRCP